MRCGAVLEIGGEFEPSAMPELCAQIASCNRRCDAMVPAKAYRGLEPTTITATLRDLVRPFDDLLNRLFKAVWHRGKHTDS
jgi:hypothetical protein